MRYRDPSEVERDLDATRARLGSTIDALQQKLSPGQILDQTLAYVRSNGPSRFGHNLAHAVQENPLPVTLVGLGLGWLALAGRAGPYDASAGPGYAQAAASGLHEQAARWRESASSATEAASERMSAAGHAVASAGRGVQERAQMTSQRVSDIGTRTVAALQEQPLLLAAAGISLGALLAALLPVSRQEEELAGRIEDAVRERAPEAADKAARYAREHSAEVAEAAASYAREATEAAVTQAERAAEGERRRAERATVTESKGAGATPPPSTG